MEVACGGIGCSVFMAVAFNRRIYAEYQMAFRIIIWLLGMAEHLRVSRRRYRKYRYLSRVHDIEDVDLALTTFRLPEEGIKISRDCPRLGTAGKSTGDIDIDGDEAYAQVRVCVYVRVRRRSRGGLGT